MAEDSNPNSRHLKVLPHSGQADKVEQLKQEFQREKEQAAQSAPQPAAPPGPAASQPQTGAAPSPENLSIEQKLIQGKVIAALRLVYDPEIPVNIYDLGLIYGIDVHPQTHAVHVRMTLTAPNCPVAGSLPREVESRVQAIPEIPSAQVELVWDPPWSKDRLSESARLELGF